MYCASLPGYSWKFSGGFEDFKPSKQALLWAKISRIVERRDYKREKRNTSIGVFWRSEEVSIYMWAPPSDYIRVLKIGEESGHASRVQTFKTINTDFNRF